MNYRRCVNAYTDLVEKSKGKNHLGDLSVDARIIFRSIVKKERVWTGTGFIKLRVGCCEHGN
jgi:hypothetical protein